MSHVLRGMYILVVALLALVWERALRLGAAYDYLRGPAPQALRECDWGTIIVGSAMLLPLSMLGLFGPRHDRPIGWPVMRTMAAVIAMPAVALTLFLVLGSRGYVD